MRRKYHVIQGAQVSTIEYDAEEKRMSDRDARDEERTTLATSIRHAIATLSNVDKSTSSIALSVSVKESTRLLRDALHRITGTRS